MSIYEKIIPFKKMPYGLFWFLLGVLFGVAIELILYLFEGKSYYVTVLFLSTSIFIWPTVFIWFSRSFSTIMTEISELMWENQDCFKNWLSEREKRIFSFRNFYPKIISLIFGLGIPLTLCLLGIPVQNISVKILVLLALGFISFIGGHYAYVFIDLIITLREISNRPIRTPFFRLPHPSIVNLQRFYSTITMFILFAFSSLLFTVWNSPYGLHPYLLVWLSILGVYPFAMFLWSMYLIHKMMVKAKQSYIDIVNNQIQLILKNAIENSDDITFERLSKVVDIQVRVQKLDEWPISFSESITFVLTITTIVMQIAISLKNALHL